MVLDEIPQIRFISFGYYTARLRWFYLSYRGFKKRKKKAAFNPKIALGFNF